MMNSQRAPTTHTFMAFPACCDLPLLLRSDSPRVPPPAKLQARCSCPPRGLVKRPIAGKPWLRRSSVGVSHRFKLGL
eukprot:3765712-Alexandrium_andersonii.AAC.1